MCDTWVAMRDVTRAGQVILAKNSDRPVFDCQPLGLYPRMEWPAGSMIQLEYLAIQQVEHTHALLGSGPYWCWGFEEGINEHGVVIGNEAIYTKTFRKAAAAYRAGAAFELGLLGMDLVRLALERSARAVQAVEVLGELVETYGQFGSGVPSKDHAVGGYDNAFLVADPQEAWIVEAMGRRWVARRIVRGSASISNQLSIRTEWDAGSTDLEAHAREQGWWPTGTAAPFDMARAYIDETVPRHLSHIRVRRAQQLLAEQAGCIDLAWMKRIARDHYESTFLQGPYFDAADPDCLSLCMHVSPGDFTWGNTASSCVAILPATPEELPVFWWTPGPPCNGCYVPFFVQGSRLPASVTRAGTAGKKIAPPPEAPIDTFAASSFWWLFRQLMDRVKGDPVGARPGYYPARNQLVRERFDPLEQQFAEEVQRIQHRYRATGDSQVLDEFMEASVQQVVVALQDLLQDIETL